MPLRIAFDMDGVLANMTAAVDRVAQTLFEDAERDEERASIDGFREVDSLNAVPADEAVESGFDPIALSSRQRRQLAQRLNRIENFWETLQEIEPGVVAELARIASTRRWEVIFLTRRPPTVGDTPQVQTQRWLQRHGFSMPSVFVVSGSRGRVATALSLDVVVDDRPENCLDVVLESQAKAVLICRNKESDVPPKARRLGISVAASVAECLDVLTQIDELHQKPGMLGRIKRLLGIEGETLGT